MVEPVAQMDEGPDDYWEDTGDHRYESDRYKEDAKETIRSLFQESPDAVFYLRQLEVKLEKKFFHWVTARAVRELLEVGFLGTTEEALRGATRIHFLFRRAHRYHRRQVSEALAIVREYSQPEIARACGLQAETLFLNALAGEGFVVKGRNTRTASKCIRR